MGRKRDEVDKSPLRGADAEVDKLPLQGTDVEVDKLPLRGTDAKVSESLKTPSVTVLSDGTICIGDSCSVIRIPLKGDVQIDVSQCPESVKQAVRSSIGSGSSTEYILSKRQTSNEEKGDDKNSS